MYETFKAVLKPLPDETILYPGHDYMKTNLGFSLVWEPNNEDTTYWQRSVESLQPNDMPYMTLGQERLYNPFLRLESPSLIAKLEASGESITSSRAVFTALRSRRDKW